MSMDQKYPLTAGFAAVSNGAPSATALPAPGAGRVHRLAWGVLTISVAATGGGGLISIKDGTTVINSFPASATGAFYLQWGDQGYPITANSPLNVVSEGAVTTQATAQVSITGFIAG